MKLRKNKSENTEKITRFKLYKSGKLWIVAGITACSILGGSFMQSTAVHADAVSEATSIHMANNETHSVSAPDTQAISNEESSKNTTSPKATTTTGSSTQKTGVLSNSTSTTQASSLTGSQASNATVSESSSQASMTSNNDTNTAGSSTDSTVGSQAVSAVTSEASSQGSNATSTAPVKDASSPVGSNAVTSSNSQSSETGASSNQVASTATKATSAASSVTSQPVTAKKATLNLMTVSASAPATDVWNIGDTTRPRVDVVDVASYQSTMTQSDYNKLKAAGIKTVIIKATEGTGYTNPAALAQARMANAAGLNVDFYHYATFNTADSARAEATYLGNLLVNNQVSKKVLLFADMEDAKTYTVNATANLNTFWSVLNTLGYTNHGVYTSTTYLYRDAVIRTVGQSRVWRAQYPYTPSNTNLWNTGDGAWQFSSTALLPEGSDYTGFIDVSIDYNGFTSNSAGTKTFLEVEADQETQVYVNQYKRVGNKLYYYGSNGQPITGLRQYGNNKLEYYGTDHVQYRNRYATVNHQLYY
ncbi:GH25 family lysozyme, partial [Lactiplantibacillus plantarum]